MLPIGYFSPAYRQNLHFTILPAATDDDMGIGAKVMPVRCLIALPAPPTQLSSARRGHVSVTSVAGSNPIVRCIADGIGVALA
jgi:hypothetical protein